MPLTLRSTLTAALGVVLLGGAVAWVFAGAPPLIGIDDANIYMVYARNLARGDGLVFTPGFERVEGATSILWAVLGSLAFRLPGRPEFFLLLLNVLFTTVGLALILEVFRSATGSDESAHGGSRRGLLALIVLLLLGIPPFFTWTVVTLMDSAFWFAAVAALGYCLATGIMAPGPWSPRRLAGTSVVVALATLARPEAFLIVPLALASFVLASPEPVWTSIKRLGIPVVTALAAAAGLAGFRVWYFGFPLPNTYYAKVPPELGYRVASAAMYLAEFAVRNTWIIPLMLLGSIPILWVLGDRFRIPRTPNVTVSLRVAAFCAALGLAGFAIPVGTGGDHFQGHRVLQPFLPWLLVPLALVLCPFLRSPAFAGLVPWMRSRVFVAWATVSALALVTDRWMEFRIEGAVGWEFQIAEDGRALGTALNARLGDPRAVRVGAITVGGLAYAFEGRVVDLLGLNWVAMAHAPGDRRGAFGHSAFDRDILLQEKPELVTPLLAPSPDASSAPGCRWDRAWETMTLKGLYTDPEFQAAYTPVVAPGPDGSIRAFARRDWLGTPAARAFRALEWSHDGACLVAEGPPAA